MTLEFYVDVKQQYNNNDLTETSLAVNFIPSWRREVICLHTIIILSDADKYF